MFTLELTPHHGGFSKYQNLIKATHIKQRDTHWDRYVSFGIYIKLSH